MHQTVAAQDRVASRQRIPRDIGEMIFTPDVTRRNTGLQTLDQRRNDVDADRANAQIGVVDPARFAAGRIQQRGNGEFAEKPW